VVNDWRSSAERDLLLLKQPALRSSQEGPPQQQAMTTAEH